MCILTVTGKVAVKIKVTWRISIFLHSTQKTTVIISNYNTLYYTGYTIGLIHMLRDYYLNNTAHCSFDANLNVMDFVALL